MTTTTAPHSLVRNGRYIAWLISDTAKGLASALFGFAIPLIVLFVTGDPAQAGVIGAVGMAVRTITTLLGGVLADRHRRIAMMITGSLVGVILSAAFTVLALADALTFVTLLVIEILLAARTGLFDIAGESALKEIVPDDAMGRAQAANQGRDAVLQLAGGPLGGVLLAAGGWLIGAAMAVCHVVAMATAWMLQRSASRTFRIPDASAAPGRGGPDDGVGLGRTPRVAPRHTRVGSGRLGFGTADARDADARDAAASTADAWDADTRGSDASAADAWDSDIRGSDAGTADARGADAAVSEVGMVAAVHTAIKPNARREIVEGFRWLLSRPDLRGVLFVATVINLGFSTAMTTIIYALQQQGESPLTIGLLATGAGVAMLLGALVAPFLVSRVRAGVAIIAGLAVSTLGVFVLIPVHEPLALAAVLGVIVLFVPTVNAALMGYFMVATPTELLGRANSASAVLGMGAMPLAPIVAGFGLSLIGREFTLVVAAALCAVAVLLACGNRALRALPVEAGWTVHARQFEVR